MRASREARQQGRRQGKLRGMHAQANGFRRGGPGQEVIQVFKRQGQVGGAAEFQIEHTASAGARRGQRNSRGSKPDRTQDIQKISRIMATAR